MNESIEEVLRPVVIDLEKVLISRLRGIKDPVRRSDIFTQVISDRCSDIEELLREMLTEYDPGV